jgi:hypothetical protein
MNKSLVCRCGAVMISNGQEFSCPHRENINYNHDPSVPDIRIGLAQPRLDFVEEAARKTLPPETLLSPPKQRPRIKPRIHKGPQLTCRGCNPTFAPARRENAQRKPRQDARPPNGGGDVVRRPVYNTNWGGTTFKKTAPQPIRKMARA